MRKPRVVIISPALANANNGNWQTAWRWSRMLASEFDVSIAQAWNGEPAHAMLALHARRSAPSAQAWAQSRNADHNAPGLAVVLTGTDLYRDIQTDPLAQQSLVLAQKLVVLQELGVAALPSAARSKARVIFQSTSSRQTLAKPTGRLRALMVGHLRDEKSPQTLFEAAHRLQEQTNIRIDHIGEPLDAALAEQAQATALACPHYRWLGGLPHEATRRYIQRAHLLVHASQMEGGAHVVMEAVCSGTPVIASKIDGNVGMLGSDYLGYFEHGDADALADLLCKAAACGQQIAAAQSKQTSNPNPNPNPNPTQSGDFLADLQAQCQLRAPLFAPAAEQAALVGLVKALVL